ncbi:hypothetical protein CHS0354_014524 [Potamilus streckersoni]|uniref:Uncharacterized protein n=1 Tax=Potamilus streckersoni TaxID=2493646 RepID=A0AAE0VT29_9BIVA|nr:hypothetical protein CHS0354_014524 [Potamilus streckersoni]
MGTPNFTSEINETESVQYTQPSELHWRLKLIIDGLIAECSQRHQHLPFPVRDGPYCNRTVDIVGGCWDDTPAGSMAVIQCPDIPGYNTKAQAHKQCTINGTWYVTTSGREWANYSSCLSQQKEEDTRRDIFIYVVGFSLSLLMLTISLFIFFRFKQLRCDRITIHKNLFISYVFTGVSWMPYYFLVSLDGPTQLENPLWCQVLFVATQYFTACNFLWMFCEGLYLNTIMVYAFNSGKVLIISCYVIGWLFPLVLTGIYAGVRGSTKSEMDTIDCWLHDSSYQWILNGPVILSITVNVIFLINIVRLLVTKLRQMPEASQTRKATRATLILVPLLGLQYLLFPVRPEKGTVLAEVYHVTVALAISLQGALVSLIYCFCNGEVLSIMKRKWKQHRLMRGGSIRSAGRGASTTYTTAETVSQVPPGPFYNAINSKSGSELEMRNLDNHS